MKRGNPIIAIAQIRYYDNSKLHNVEKIKKYIRLAKKRKADIICFPESCVHKNKFLKFDGPLISEIREECKKNSIWCIIDDDMRIRGRLYSAAILINREGKITGHYKKINLYGDTEGIVAGKRPHVFKTDLGKIGIAICWDLAHPGLFKEMKKKGAQIVFCPAFWKYELRAHNARKYEKKHKEKEMATLKSLVMTRAFENLFFVALCNPVVDDKDMVSYSAVSSPHKILAEIKNKEGMIFSKINLNEIEKLHKVYSDDNIN